MDYLKNARKTRGKEEYYIVQSLQLQPLLCRPRDRRSAVAGTSFNGRGTVSGASFKRRGAVSGSQVIIKQRLSTVVAAPCAGLAPSEHTNITLTYTHCKACPFVAVRYQRTINEHQFLTQPTVGTLVRASASGGAPSRGQVSMGGAPSRGLVSMGGASSRGPVSIGEVPSRGTQVMIKQRLSTVVAAPCAGLAPSEHTNITLTYTHCRACPFVAVRNQRTINEHQFHTTHL